MAPIGLLQATKDNQKIIGNHYKEVIKAEGEDNLLRKQTITYQTVTHVLGSTNYTTLEASRVERSMHEQQRLDIVNKYENSATINDAMQRVKNIIKGSDDISSKIVEACQEMTSIASNYSGDTNIDKKRFVNASNIYATKINQISDEIKSLRQDAHNNIKIDVGNLNTQLKLLYDLNKSLLTADDNLELLNHRDALIAEVTKYIDCDVRYLDKGCVAVRAKGFVDDLVNVKEYMKLKVSNSLSEDSILKTGKVAITYEAINNSGKADKRGSVMNDSHSVIKGGSIGANIALRDNNLKEIYDSIITLKSKTMDDINKLHNRLSAYPPKTIFIGQNKFALADDVNWNISEPIKIYPMDKNGRPLVKGYETIKPIIIDVASIKNANGFDQPSIKDLVAEINAQLSTNISRNKAAIGKFMEANVEDSKGANYLLNNVSMIASSAVNEGNFTFNMEFEGNNFYASKIDILSIKKGNGGNGQEVQTDLPQNIAIKAGENLKVEEAITISGITPADNEITVEIRVEGENGRVFNGSVTFEINSQQGANQIGQRIDFNPDYLTNDFALEISRHNGIGSAKLVDSKNIELSNSNEEYGQLVIETNDPNLRLAIESAEFGNAMGINDFYQIDSDGKLFVRPDLLADPSLMSYGSVKQSQRTVESFEVGKNAAKMDLTFLGNINAGSSFDLKGETFNFVAGPAAPAIGMNDVSIAGAGPLANLRDKINAHPVLSKDIEAKYDQATGILSLSAKIPGEAGNEIAINANILGGGTVELRGGGAVTSLNNEKFSGGTNEIQPRASVEYSLGEKSSEFMEGIAALDLDEFASKLDQNLVMIVKSAEEGKIIIHKTLERFNQELSDMAIIDQATQVKSLMSAAYFTKMLSSLLSMHYKVTQYLLQELLS